MFATRISTIKEKKQNPHDRSGMKKIFQFKISTTSGRSEFDPAANLVPALWRSNRDGEARYMQLESSLRIAILGAGPHQRFRSAEFPCEFGPRASSLGSSRTNDNSSVWPAGSEKAIGPLRRGPIATRVNRHSPTRFPPTLRRLQRRGQVRFFRGGDRNRRTIRRRSARA